MGWETRINNHHMGVVAVNVMGGNAAAFTALTVAVVLKSGRRIG